MTNRLQAFPSPAIRRIAIVAMSIVLAPTLAHAQSADLVLCDRLAADPADPDKPADVKGVSDVAPSDIAIRAMPLVAANANA